MSDYQNSSPTTLRSSEPASNTSGFLQPERMIPRLEVRPGMQVADFGCGSGHFSIPLARSVGELGKVFSIDVQKQSIDLIKSRANLEHLLQIETIWADLEGPQGSHLHENSIDFVVVSNILFQVERKDNVINEAYRILKPGGCLVMIEWDDTPFPAGPAPELRIAKKTARLLAEGSHFTMEKEFDAGSHHYGLLFRKQQTVNN